MAPRRNQWRQSPPQSYRQSFMTIVKAPYLHSILDNKTLKRLLQKQKVCCTRHPAIYLRFQIEGMMSWTEIYFSMNSRQNHLVWSRNYKNEIKSRRSEIWPLIRQRCPRKLSGCVKLKQKKELKTVSWTIISQQIIWEKWLAMSWTSISGNLR